MGQHGCEDHHAVADLMQYLECDQLTAKKLLIAAMDKYPGLRSQITRTRLCLEV